MNLKFFEFIQIYREYAQSPRFFPKKENLLKENTFLSMRAVSKFRGLAAERRYYAEGGITT
jgi:hypothetical protein